jgi:hypothetical protein
MTKYVTCLVLNLVLLSRTPTIVAQGNDRTLREAFGRLVEAERVRNWRVCYQLLRARQQRLMLEQDYIKQRGIPSKNDYVLVSMWGAFLKELPAKEYGSARWLITGCARFKHGGRYRDLTTDTEAVWEDGGWRFSDLGLRSAIDGHPDPCNPKRFPSLLGGAQSRDTGRR